MKKFLSGFAALAVISVTAAFLTGAAPKRTPARAYVLIEAATGTVLDGENADSPLNVGYLSKLMTILLVGEDIRDGLYSEDTVLTASDSVTGTKGSVIWLENGDKLSVGELLKAVAVGNANDAVTVLAENSAGSVEGFVDRMNARAFDLGLRNTAFYSPYGYYDEREHSSAHDIALICAELYRLDLPYFSIWRDFVCNGTVELVSENTLTRTYSRHCGFKAAHSDASGCCIAEGGKSGDTCYISVVLGAETADDSFSLAKELIGTGFSDFKLTSANLPDDVLCPVTVKNGEKSAVRVRLECQEGIVVPRCTDKLMSRAVLPEHLTAPVESGQRVGTVGFWCGKELVSEQPIVAAESIDRVTLGFVLRKLLGYAME